MPEPREHQGSQPKISVIILNYNGLEWLPRCLDSLKRQTLLPEIEILVVDNASTDNSDAYIEERLKQFPRGRLIRNESNLFFCEGNNVGAASAVGEFLLFLNFDLWLEPDCLEKLYKEIKTADADCGTPMVLNYEDDTYQGCGSPGLDLFGMPTQMNLTRQTAEIFAAPGCSFLIRAVTFRKVGGFPREFLMYTEEIDLSWRVWIAGGKVVTVPSARIHHRGEVSVNPKGKTKVVESRTSETKRFLANRNGILLLMKNAQHILLLLLVPQLLMLSAEAMAGLLLIRRSSYVKKSFFLAIKEAFRMRKQVRFWRSQTKGFRQRGDFWMLRFLCLRPARWAELVKIFRIGPPKVDAK